MISLRNLTIGAGALALVAVAGSAAAQLGADGLPPTQQELHRSEAARPHNAGAPLASQAGGPDSVVRPAAAFPPERVQADRADEQPSPGARPVVAPRDDPRSVEETEGLPAPADR